MKKFLRMMLLLVMTFCMAGCSQPQSDSSATAEPTVPNEWGITMIAENVTPTGLTIVCSQSGGEAVSELFTGSNYAIHKLGKSGWEHVEYAPQEYDVAWTSEAWIIPLDGTVSWEINWQWLYGDLPKGTYRIEKEIINFRGPGDFVMELAYVYFEIK